MDKAHPQEYLINIDPRILELLGPSLYTNIYYVLAELIGNAYDANAHNVYVIEKKDQIIVEDDGSGMSYKDGDVAKYLNVAAETRINKEDIYVEGSQKKRRKIGRKGIGKLAALSVSDKVFVKTIKNGEKSGFVLSRHVDADHKLKALSDKEITFEQKMLKNGTSIVMTNPEYGLHKSASAIKNNLLKIFPLVNKDFKIHIDSDHTKLSIESFDAEIIKGLGALMTFGDEFSYLAKHFNPTLPPKLNKIAEKDLLKKEKTISIPVELQTKDGKKKGYDLKIKGWIGAYRTTRDRKMDRNDFPDNFISLLSNGKMGEYNILSVVGKNKLPEVYIVGQLHVDLFEETELPDMALSNRQGYKSDDPRYMEVIKHVSNHLLPDIVKMRKVWASYNKEEKDKVKQERQKKMEEELRKKVNKYQLSASAHAAKKIQETNKINGSLKTIIRGEMNTMLPIIGLKRRIDTQKKKILISHASSDKSLADIICKMLIFNNIPPEDIIYTSSDNQDCRIPEGEKLFEYLRDFFVDSISDQKIFVVYVTSNEMAKSWFAVTEVGAGWITQSAHKVFNLKDHKPQKPLDTDVEWQTSTMNADDITMSSREFDKFIVKILDICKKLGYKAKTKKHNQTELKRYVKIV